MPGHNHDEHEAEDVCTDCSGLTEHAQEHGDSCSCGHDHDDHGHDHGDLNWTKTTFAGVAITAGVVMEVMGVGGFITRISGTD